MMYQNKMIKIYLQIGEIVWNRNIDWLLHFFFLNKCHSLISKNLPKANEAYNYNSFLL